MNEYSGIDWDNKWSYPLQYLYESEIARRVYLDKIYRVQLAMQGDPFDNLYEQELTNVISRVEDKERRSQLEKKCLPIPTVKSFALEKAVKNRASQMASGVDTYEYVVNDPYMIIDDETEDLLAAKCEEDYVENKLNFLSSTVSTDLTKYGMFACIIDYDPCKDKNIIKRIHPKNCWFDTKYSTTGQERFRGYNKMISWAKLKKMLQDDPNEEINLDIKAPDRSMMKEKNDKWEVDKTAKYANRKDPQSQQRMQAETMAVYKKYKVNPLGCLGTMFLQFPIFMSMYEVVKRVNATSVQNINGVEVITYGKLALADTTIDIFGLSLELNTGFSEVSASVADKIFAVILAVPVFLAVTFPFSLHL